MKIVCRIEFIAVFIRVYILIFKSIQIEFFNYLRNSFIFYYSKFLILTSKALNMTFHFQNSLKVFIA